MSALGYIEQVDRRVLGGFVFRDAVTKATVTQPLMVGSPLLKLGVNRSGIYSVLDAPGFTSQTTQFEPSAWPAAQNFEVTVQDMSLRYLARRVQVQAPQPLATLGIPQAVAMYPSSSGVLAPNWAVVRASVTGNAGQGLPWAMVQVIRSDSTVVATGMADARGEALLAVAGLGLQVSTGSSGAVTENTIPVTVKAWFDPGVLTQPSGWIPDPDDILSNLSSASLKTGQMTGALGSTMVLFAAITISV